MRGTSFLHRVAAQHNIVVLGAVFLTAALVPRLVTGISTSGRAQLGSRAEYHHADHHAQRKKGKHHHSRHHQSLHTPRNPRAFARHRPHEVLLGLGHRMDSVELSGSKALSRGDHADDHVAILQKQKKPIKGEQASLLDVKSNIFPETLQDEAEFARDFVADDNDFMLRQQVEEEHRESALRHKMVLQAKAAEQSRRNRNQKSLEKQGMTAEQSRALKLQTAMNKRGWVQKELEEEKKKYEALVQEVQEKRTALETSKASLAKMQTRLQENENATQSLESRGLALDEERSTEESAYLKSSHETKLVEERYREKARDFEDLKNNIRDIQKRLKEYREETAQLERGGKLNPTM